MARPRIFISHSTRDEASGQVLEGLVAALHERKYAPFLDRERLETGKPWRDPIYNDLLLCHGAVLEDERAEVRERMPGFRGDTGWIRAHEGHAGRPYTSGG